MQEVTFFGFIVDWDSLIQQKIEVINSVREQWVSNERVLRGVVGAVGNGQF